MDQTAVSGLGRTLAIQECDEMRRYGFGGGSVFIGIFWIFRSTLDFILTTILGPSAPRLGTLSGVQVGNLPLYLYCTIRIVHAPSTVVAVKYDGPLRCIAAVVSSVNR